MTHIIKQALIAMLVLPMASYSKPNSAKYTKADPYVRVAIVNSDSFHQEVMLGLLFVLESVPSVKTVFIHNASLPGGKHDFAYGALVGQHYAGRIRGLPDLRYARQRRSAAVPLQDVVILVSSQYNTKYSKRFVAAARPRHVIVIVHRTTFDDAKQLSFRCSRRQGKQCRGPSTHLLTLAPHVSVSLKTLMGLDAGWILPTPEILWGDAGGAAVELAGRASHLGSKAILASRGGLSNPAKPWKKGRSPGPLEVAGVASAAVKRLNAGKAGATPQVGLRELAGMADQPVKLVQPTSRRPQLQLRQAQGQQRQLPLVVETQKVQPCGQERNKQQLSSQMTLPLLPEASPSLLLSGFGVQGGLKKGRRNFTGLLMDMAAAVPSSQLLRGDPRFRIHILASSTANVSELLLRHNATQGHSNITALWMMHSRLTFGDFYGLLHGMLALLPLFGSDAYLENMCSSTIATMLVTGSPLVATKRILDTYSFIPREAVFYQKRRETVVQAMAAVLRKPAAEVTATRQAVKELQRRLNDHSRRVLRNLIYTP